MKKILTVLLCVILTGAFCVTSFAKEYSYNDMYTIDMPESFFQVDSQKFAGEDNSDFSITVEENQDGKYSIENISEKKLREEAQLLAKEASKAFASIGKDGKMEYVFAEKVKHPNGMTAAVMVFKTSVTEGSEEISHYQKMYEFSGVKNKYRFVYTPYSSDDVDALDDAFNSIKINESEAKSNFDKLKDYTGLVVIVVLLSIGIFKFIRGKKPAKKKK